MRLHVVRARLILKSQNLAPGPGSRQQTEPSSDLEVQLRSFAVPITAFPSFFQHFQSASGRRVERNGSSRMLRAVPFPRCETSTRKSFSGLKGISAEVVA